MDKAMLIRFAARGQKAAAAAFGGITERVATLQDRVSRANRQALRSEKLNKKLEKAADAQGLISQYKSLKKELKTLKVQTKLGGQAASEAKRKWRGNAEELRRVSRAMRQAGIDTRKLTEHQRRLEHQTDQLTRKNKKLQKAQKAKTKASGSGLGGIGGGLVGGLVTGAMAYSPLGKAISIEDAQADVKKVMDFSAPDGLQKLTKQLIDFSATETSDKPKDLLAIAAAGGQLGVSEKAILAYVKTTSKMKNAWDMTAEESGEASAKLSNIWKIPIERLELLGDAINHLSDNTAAQAPEILNVTKRTSGMAKQFGLSAVQAAALGSAFIALGRPPEVAATGINALLNKLQTADKQGKKFQEGLAAIGMDAGELKDAIQNDAQGALLKFLEAVEGIDKSERAGVLMDMFGLEFSDDLAMLVGGLDEYRKSLKLVAKEQNYAGSMTKEFQNRMSTTQSRMDITVNKLNRSFINLGTAMLPAFNRVLDVAAFGLDKMAAFQEAWPNLSTAIYTAVLGSLALVAAWKTLKVLGGGLKGGFTGLRNIGGRLRGRKSKGGLGGLAGMASGATPVFVTNWPGGGGDFGDFGGDGKRKKGKRSRAARRRLRRMRAGRGGGRFGRMASAGRALWARSGGRVVGKAGVAGAAALGGIKAAGRSGAGLLARGGSKVAAKVGLGGLAKSVGKVGMKALGKSALKKIPVVGALAGIAFGIGRALDGDWLGALGEVGSGLASTIPGIGTAASVAIDAGLAARDMVSANKGGMAKAAGRTGMGGLAKAGTKVAAEGGLKAAGKVGLKSLGKSALKKIPGVGLLAGVAFGIGRALDGDWLGALGEVGSGLASTIPGIGTAASVAIDAGLAAKDMLSTPDSPESGIAKAQAELAQAQGQVINAGAPQITIEQTNSVSGADPEMLQQALTQNNTALMDLVERAVNEIWDRNQRTSFGNVGV